MQIVVCRQVIFLTQIEDEISYTGVSNIINCQSLSQHRIIKLSDIFVDHRSFNIVIALCKTNHLRRYRLVKKSQQR